MLVQCPTVVLHTSHPTFAVSKAATDLHRWMGLQHFLREEIQDLVVVRGEILGMCKPQEKPGNLVFSSLRCGKADNLIVLSAAIIGQVLPISLRVEKVVLPMVGVDHPLPHHQVASIQMPMVTLQRVGKKDRMAEVEATVVATAVATLEVAALLLREALVMGNGGTDNMCLALKT